MTDAELLQKLEEIFRENFDDGTITLTPEGFLVEGSLIPFLLWG